MFQNQFYNRTLLRYVELFEYLFKDIQIKRVAADGREQLQVIPINFSAGEKYIQGLSQDPDLTKPVSMQLPRLGYDLVSIQRNPTRQLNPLNRIVNNMGDGNVGVRYVPIPYDLTFELYIKARNTEDAFKIVEQIMPYFTPYFSLEAALVDGLPSFPVVINLDNSTKFDRFEGNIGDTRDLQWVMIFTLHGWVFGPDMGSSTAGGLVQIKWVDSVLQNMNNIATANIANVISSNTYVYLANTAIANIESTDAYTIITSDKDYIK